MRASLKKRAAAVVLPVAAAAVLVSVGRPAPVDASSTFRVGIPTIVDPIRGVGEPDILVDNSGNALIDGPAGTGTQTSFFWRSRDGGLTYPQLGPANGHWICPASGGGDSLGVIDRKNGDLYLTDQEALASIGSAKIKGSDNSFTSQCASAPGITADRPFESVLDSTTAPQTVADAAKPILYLSWLCSGCGASTNGVGGLAFGWSDDGLTFHPADPGVTGDDPLTNTFQEGGTINSFAFHGNMVADPKTGYVYTAISCAGASSGSPSGCPNGASDNEVGVVIGTPQRTPTGNIGEFSKLTYQPAVTTDPGGAAMAQPNSLFPVVGMDRNGTLYEAYIEGDGFADPTVAPPSTAWHLYYTYSKDKPNHKVWSPPIQVDSGSATATSDFGWMAVGDPGKVGFIWLGTDVREHPSAQDAGTPRQWHPFMAVTTNALAATPTFQQAEVGIGPNHINDMCLQGTVGCIQNVGNRNMADFISADIDPTTGALQGTWANDSNRLATQPSTLIPGLPLTETAREISGPRLVGSGPVSDTRFSATPTTTGIGDATGDALYPVQGGTNVPQLDITHSSVIGNDGYVVVDVQVASLADRSSPDSVNQTHVWWLTTWQMNHTIYFARAESDSGGAIKCAAGQPTSFDRPGLNAQTVATLVDYSGGTAVACKVKGNDIHIKVPISLVGTPADKTVIEAVTSFTALDNGAPLAVGPGGGNIPTIVDATPAYNAKLTDPSLQVAAGISPALPIGAAGGFGILAALGRLRRRTAR